MSRRMPRLPEWSVGRVKTDADIEAFLRAAIEEVGLGFHLDTPFAEYVETSTGARCFTDEEAVRLDACVQHTFQIAGEAEEDDPYAVALRIMQPMIAATGGREEGSP